MKRILEMFGEPITYGGQESVVYNMLSTFRLGEDFIVDLFTPYYADNKGLIELVEKNNGKVFSLDVDFKTNDNRFLLTKFIDDFFSSHSDYEVVHIHTGSLSTMCVYAKSAKMHGVKKVIVHAHIANHKINLNYRLRRYILCKVLNKYVDVYLGCSKVAIESKWTKNIVGKSIVVCNGIDVEKFKFNSEYRNEIKNQYRINDKFVIGSVGRLDYQKNNFFMLDIIKELISYKNNICLMLVGDGNCYDELVQKCKELNIENYVIFTGRQIDVFKYYNAFDCFILPSRFEGMPVVAVEAQISGLPCLISDNVTKECNISTGTAFLPILGVNIWVNKINEISKNKDKELKRDKFTIDFDKYDRNKTFKIVENIYLDKS